MREMKFSYLGFSLAAVSYSVIYSMRNFAIVIQNGKKDRTVAKNADKINSNRKIIG